MWVHLDPPREPLEAFLGPFRRGRNPAKAFDGLAFAGRKSYDLACNWKVYADNYLDGGYHVNTVHPALAGVLDYREYRPCDGHTGLQSSPMKPAEGDAGRTRTGDWPRTGGCTRTSC